MKTAFIIVAACLGLFLSSAASAQEQRAISFSILGEGPPVDVTALQRVRTILGRELAKGRATKVIVSSVGFVEGGLAGCVELESPRAARETLAALARIRPNPRTTSYNLKAKQSCTCE